MFNTRRLCIRSLRTSDFRHCFKTRKASQLSMEESTGSLLGIAFDDRTLFRALIEYRNEQMAQDRAYHYGIFLRQTEAFVGEVMLFNVMRGIHQNAEAGAIIHSPYRRRGYAREALGALIRHGFRELRLHRIEGLADPENSISIKMCLQLGFRIECVSSRRIKAKGRWRDTVMLALTRDEI